MTRILIVVTTTAMLTTQAVAQDRGAAPQFEVVSVKATAGARGGPGPVVTTSPGRFFARGTLQFLVQYAYGVRHSSQLAGGPAWISSERFDVEATADPIEGSLALFPVMMRTALAQRFGLAVHQERRELPVLALTMDRMDARLVPAADSDTPRTAGTSGHLIATRMSMRGLAAALTRITNQLVVDRTGLEGDFNFELMWSPDEFSRADARTASTSLADHPGIFTAVREQLGLRLESGRERLEVLVVDQASRPSAN